MDRKLVEGQLAQLNTDLVALHNDYLRTEGAVRVLEALLANDDEPPVAE